MNNSVGNNIPKVDGLKNKKLYQSFYKASQKQLISSAISIARGRTGSCFGKNSSCRKIRNRSFSKQITGKVTRNDFTLFSESQGRILATINPKNKKEFEKIFEGNQFKEIGKVTNNQQLIINGLDNKKVVDLNLEQVERAYKSTFKNY